MEFVMVYFGAETDDLYTGAHVPFAQGEDKIRFFHNNDAACAAGYGGPGIVFFRNFEEPQHRYPGTGDIREWVKPLRVPTIFAFADDKIELIFE